MGNSGSAAEKRANAIQFKKWTKCEQATIVLMWLLGALLGVVSIVAIVLTAILYNSGDDANRAVKELTDGLNSVNALHGDCFTCDTRTGDVKFNSTLNIERTRITSEAQFYIAGQPNIGLNLPGYSFMYSPLSAAIDGAPMVTGDIVFAPDSNLDQFSDGLPQLEPQPDSYTLAQTKPSPVGFGPSILVNDNVQSATTISSIRIGTFNTVGDGATSQSERCKVNQITPSPSAYFIVRESGLTNSMYLCVCISNQGGAVGSGSGEHCSDTEFVTSLFPPIP